LEPPAEYPAFFPFVSAKTGAGVPELFEYIARRVVERWEWEESGAGSEWGGCGVDDGEGVDLGGGKGKKKIMGGCC
jgi:Ras-related protein Rab-7A